MTARRKKSKPGLVHKAFLVANILAVLALLICYLSSVVSPAVFWPIAFVSLAYPLLLFINVAFALVWLFRRPLYSLISVIAIALGFKFLVSHIGFREPTAIQVPKSSKDVLRVMTWNVHYFRKFKDNQWKTTVVNQMMDVIRNEQPDVLCIQEFSMRMKGEFNSKKRLSELLKTKHYYYEEDYGNGFESNGYAIFSKYPIKKSGKLDFPKITSGNEVIFADIKVDGTVIRVYNVHLQSFSFQPEDYEYLNEVKKDIKTDVGSTKRLSRRMKNAFIRRAEQVDIIKEHIRNLEMPYIVAGDFNDTPVSYAVNTLSEGMKNTFRQKGSGFGITYNGDFPNFQIDYIFASRQFDVKNYIIIDEKLSDHYAVRSDLELKP